MLKKDRQLAYIAGLVHNIGMVAQPPGLLEKPGPLSAQEREQMRTHPQIGEQVLSEVDDYTEVARIVRCHHERIDGGGYPDGLESEAIPLIARIVGVAEAYNAMTTDRSYASAMPSRVARMVLAQEAGRQFDSSFVEAFEELLAVAAEAYRTPTSAEFDLEAPTAWFDVPAAGRCGGSRNAIASAARLRTHAAQWDFASRIVQGTFLNAGAAA